MTLVIKATRGAVSGSNSWTNAANAVSDNGSYATCAPGKNAVVSGDWDFDAFSDVDLPVGATINSVVIRAQYKVSTTSSVATFGVDAGNNGSFDGQETQTTEPTSDTNFDVTFNTAPSEADLKTEGQIVARVTGRRGNSNTAVTFSLDYVELRVDYTEAVGATEADGAATAAATAVGVGRSTARASAAATGTASASGAGASTARSTGSGTGTASASGTGVATARAQGSASATATASGVAEGQEEPAEPTQAVGLAEATSTAVGVGAATVRAVGTASATSEALGVAYEGEAEVSAPPVDHSGFSVMRADIDIPNLYRKTQFNVGPRFPGSRQTYVDGVWVNDDAGLEEVGAPKKAFTEPAPWTPEPPEPEPQAVPLGVQSLGITKPQRRVKAESPKPARKTPAKRPIKRDDDDAMEALLGAIGRYW